MNEPLVNLRVTRKQAHALLAAIEERRSRLLAETRVDRSLRTTYSYDLAALRDLRDSLRLLLVHQEGPR